MKQRTVKRAVEAWYWIANTDHFEVGTEYHPTKLDDAGRPARTAVYFRNHHEKMRVPQPLLEEVFEGILPNRRKFDTRMYALRKHARIATSR